jgi:predicted DNA-binding helix-hairpin-helix protein
MDLYQKISILGPGARYDTCGPKDFGQTTNIPGVYQAKVAGGVCRLFKVLQTNTCLNNCRYCAFRRDRSCPRVSATPDEMAKAFLSAHSRRLVDGLFLSSGIVKNPEFTMSRMLDTAHILRDKYRYSGYLHLKIMPGTPPNCVQESLNLANRISLNIESPTQEDLTNLSPDKDLKNGFFKTLFAIRKFINQRKKSGQKTPSLTTQFVVGAGEEKDLDIIRVTNLLYQSFGLKRVFYSAFRPVPQTPLAQKPATSLTREHRLYQADFLMRFYRFSPKDLPLSPDGNLFETSDPKTLWAQNNPGLFPINLNRAGYWELLKVPGIGPTSAKKIIQKRSQTKIRNLSQLKDQRIQLKKLSTYVSC